MPMNKIHRKRNYDICTAIDSIALGVVLAEMRSDLPEIFL
jgi:hypothetical protein